MCDATKFFFVCLLTRFLLHFTCEEIKAKPGDDVTLQCQGPREGAIELLEWNKPGLKSVDCLFYFRGKRSDNKHQDPSFCGRAELRDPEMKDGDASVILKNVSISDTGTYECHFVNSGSGPQLRSITLTVGDSEIKAKPGDDVTLQCQGPREEAIELLEWSKPDLGSQDYVFYFRDKRSYENYQHPLFRGRVELRDPQMKEGDMSVILKNVHINDSGTYECYFGNSGSGPQLLSNIILTVRDSGDGAGDTEDGGKKDGHVGLIVGLSVPVVLVLVVVGLVALMIFRKHHGQNLDQPEPSDTDAAATDV